jgi:hypothetical protein
MAHGQFDDPMTIDLNSLVAKGPLWTDHCYVIGVFILQSNPDTHPDTQDPKGNTVRDLAAACGLGNPKEIPRPKDDHDGLPGKIWTLALQQDPSSNRDLEEGRALATVVALVGLNSGSTEMVQWCQAIELKLKP